MFKNVNNYLNNLNYAMCGVYMLKIHEIFFFYYNMINMLFWLVAIKRYHNNQQTLKNIL